MSISNMLRLAFLFAIGLHTCSFAQDAQSSSSADGTAEREEREWLAAKQVFKSNAGYTSLFLLKYPTSRFASEARALLASPYRGRAKPAVLTEASQQCREKLDYAAKHFFAGVDTGRSYLLNTYGIHIPNYRFILPDDAFRDKPTIEYLPVDWTQDNTPIEHRFYLDLIVGQDGGCTLVNRWNHGVGLPGCVCKPVD